MTLAHVPLTLEIPAPITLLDATPDQPALKNSCATAVITPRSLLYKVVKKFWIPIILVPILSSASMMLMIRSGTYTNIIMTTLSDRQLNYQAITNFVLASGGVAALRLTSGGIQSFYQPSLNKFLIDSLGEYLLHHDKDYFTKHKTGQITFEYIAIRDRVPEMINAVFSLLTFSAVIIGSAVPMCKPCFRAIASGATPKSYLQVLALCGAYSAVNAVMSYVLGAMLTKLSEKQSRSF